MSYNIYGSGNVPLKGIFLWDTLYFSRILLTIPASLEPELCFIVRPPESVPRFELDVVAAVRAEALKHVIAQLIQGENEIPMLWGSDCKKKWLQPWSYE